MELGGALLLGPLVPLGFFGLLVLLVVAVRGETDPGGRRPYAAYLFLVCFVGVFVLLFSTFALADAGVRVITGTDAHNGSHIEFGVGSQRFTACGRSIWALGSLPPLQGLVEPVMRATRARRRRPR